ncbi:MAG: Rha family transcriptional regulator [Leptospirales bacterium]
MSIPALSPSVEIVENHPVTSSRKVAEYFGKDHKNVLRDIQNLPCSPEFNQLNFEPVEYADAKGEKRPEYLLTKNGFVFLVMGFTGARAASLKEAYIAEFDRMEEKLRRRELSGESPSQKPLTPDESPALPGATPVQRLILVVLARRAGPDGVCEASQQALARETGLSLRAVNRNLKGLESLGLIASKQTPGKNWKSYRLTAGGIPSLPGREDTLKSQEPGRIEGKRLGTLSPLRQELLRRAVVRKAEDAGVPPGAIWYRLMDAFHMPSHLHLDPEFFDQALLSLETRALPEGTRTKKLSDIQTGRAG